MPPVEQRLWLNPEKGFDDSTRVRELAAEECRRKRGSEDTAVGEGRFAEEIAEPVELEVVPLRSPRPLGHASTRQALKELREQYRAFVAAFREAAARWRRGDFSASFPLFSFPPRVVPGRVTRIL
jgi:hypothetical protein